MRYCTCVAAAIDNHYKITNKWRLCWHKISLSSIWVALYPLTIILCSQDTETSIEICDYIMNHYSQSASSNGAGRWELWRYSLAIIVIHVVVWAIFEFIGLRVEGIYLADSRISIQPTIYIFPHQKNGC